jgi:hypothetical protein
MQQTNPLWLVAQAPTDLKGQIRLATQYGFHVTSQTATTAQLLRAKKFSFLLAVLWLLFLGIGLLVYVLYYVSKSDDTIYLDLDTQPTGEELLKAKGSKSGPGLSAGKIALIVLGGFVVLSVIAGLLSDDTDKTNATVPASATSTRESLRVQYKDYLDQPIDKQVFDVPALIGKNVDQVKAVLGATKIKDEPTQLQLDMGTDEWSNTITKDGVDLLVTYHPKTRKVVDFFISASVVEGDQETLYKVANVKPGASNYRLEFVKANTRPGLYTGLKITPTR